ncbi:hypothetical protein SO694_00199013 [Aureococcus anophagefferens]|uniref:MobA-like NTP transferase domain-containing protein n=1 Tax=Aureococcus anophagefferens TaxID=44056 RepID=A0ABR1FP31_AURAN
MLAPSASTELTPTTIEHALTTSTEAIVRPLDIAKLAQLVGASEAEVIVALCSNTQETGRPRASSSVVSDAEQPEQQRSSRPKTARVALVTAARRKPTRRASGAGIPDAVPKELLQVGGAALICHSLEALRRAGFRRCVVLVAYRGSEIAEHVGRHFGNKLGDDFGIEFLDLGDDWDGFHGKSILAARDTVARCTDGLETPLLLVTSDHLFDASLLRSVARSTDRNRIGDDNALLVEDLGGNAEELLRALPPTAVKVAKKDGSYCARVGRELPAGVKQDGVDAGLARIEGPRLWDALEDLDASSDYYTLADALDRVALSDGGLRAVDTRNKPWVAVETDEQVEFTKVSVLSPQFAGVAPLEVHIVRQSSSQDFLSNLPFEIRHVSDNSANSSPPATPFEYSSSEAGSEKVRFAPEAFGPPVDYLAVGSSGALDRPVTLSSSMVEDLPSRGAVVVALPGDAFDVVALVPVGQRDASVKVLAASATAVGFAGRVAGFAETPTLKAIELGGNAKDGMDAKVTKKVPVMGYGLLAFATAAQASGALVLGDAEPGSDVFLLCAWRMGASSLVALPLAITDWTLGLEARVMNGDALRGAAGAVSGYFLSVVTYQLAFLLASDASLVSLSSSLAPLGIVVVRLLGLLSPRPTRSEIAGTCIGLLGACGCAASAPGSSGGRRLSATAALPLALGLSCSACHAAYACSTKAARSGGISAPALHAAMQVGCWLLSVLVFVFVEGGEFIETLAFFESPLTYLWLALVVDTAGTFFYTLAASLVDPLLVTVAALLQPLCVVIFQSTLFGSPPPGPAYLLAAACLVSGGTVVATSKAETKETVNIDAAVGVRVRCDSIRDSVDSAFSPQQSAKSRKFWRNSGEEATPLV